MGRNLVSYSRAAGRARARAPLVLAFPIAEASPPATWPMRESLRFVSSAARLRALNSFRYGNLFFHIHHSPLLGCWDDVFAFVDDVHREAVPRLVKERIVDLNSPVRRAALIDRRRDGDGDFVRYAIKQVVSELS